MMTTKLNGLLLVLLMLLSACQDNRTIQKIDYDQAFDSYLSAYTHGEISKKSTIKISFQQAIGQNAPATLYPNPFSFDPSIEGEAVWVDKHTLEFIPLKDLTSGQIYTAQLDIASIDQQITPDKSNFSFQFKTKDQFVNVHPLASTISKSENKSWVELAGELRTHDAEDFKNIEALLTAYVGDKKLAINWQHLGQNKHRFTLAKVAKTAETYPVIWEWNGQSIGSKNRGVKAIQIAPEKQFSFVKSYTRHQGQEIILEFSDLLASQQNLKGLLRIEGKKLQYSIEGNQIKLFTDGLMQGEKLLKIAAEIKSATGKTLADPIEETITFSEIKPAVAWIGKGNIIPKSSSMPVVFKTINLRGVDIRVIKVKERNVKQFFQKNNIDGNKELKRVGTVVLEKKVSFEEQDVLGLKAWTHHSLDLAELITPEPGAIYEIALGFRQSYSLYTCTGSDNEESHYEPIDMMQLPKNWDNPNYSRSYWDYYEDDYDYGDLKNPCSRYYYRPKLVAKKNILASDLGIIAKQGDNGNLFVVNNLQTTEPMPNVLIEFYDYQQELIATATTDQEGKTEANLSKKPFFLIAKSGKQRGYLRLDDGNALSMSRFDVSGSSYHKGLKGYIYGERGVWRPGEALFINFILEDKEKSLPDNHPVVFTLKDARGSIVYKKTSSESVNGIYNFSCSTDENAPTGNYLATVNVGGATFNKSLRVETVKPNRLKMNLQFGSKELTVENKKLDGNLEATWLHGAVAKSLKAKVTAKLSAKKINFKQYGDFVFNDPARSFYPEEKVIFEGKLDEKGKAKIQTELVARNQSPGMLQASFNMQVFEPGGDFSIGQATMPYHPYATYVGLRMPKGDETRNMLLTDNKHKVEILTVDQAGNPVDVEQLEVTLYKLKWKWWFDKNKEAISNYRGKVYGSEVATAKVSTKAGKGQWELEVKYPEWGRYLLRVSNGKGHSTGKVFYIDWPGWAGRSTEKDPGGATALNFTADKKNYNVGELITLNIPTGNKGRALVSIETGSKILASHWIETQKGTTQFSFEASADMAPNVYATISLLQPHAQTKNDLPIRMYGAIPITVEDPSTHLQPVLKMADELRPNESFTMTVKEQKGGPMAYTIAVVDEGILDLTNFRTPAPWQRFYKRAALGVKTWDMYNDVLGAFGGDVKSLLSIGGDGTNAAKTKKKPNRFKPVCMHLGPFYLKKGETARHQLTMPNYVGSVRAMVVAANDGAYGSTDKTLAVRQPLMVLASLPRVLGVQEQFKLPVTVFAMKSTVKKVRVELESNDFIIPVGSRTKELRFDKIGEQISLFELKTSTKTGRGSIKVTVRSGKEVAVYQTDIQIRNANPRETLVAQKSVEANKTWAATYKPLGMNGTNQAVLELSSIPPLNLAKRLKYLIRYPYGCVEQTTSSVFPQVFLTSLMDLNETAQEAVEKNIKAGIQRLYQFQNSSGGLGYWPGGKDDAWGSNYAGHFMIEAQKAGYTVRDNFMNKWIQYQTKKAQKWTTKGSVSEDLTQAYRLYLLALAGKPDMGSMNRLRLKQSQKNAIAARWYLAAAYFMVGQTKVADDMMAIAQLEALPYSGNEGALTFGSKFRDQALILQALSIMNKRDKATKIVAQISERLASNGWMNTQETAQALVAMSKYVGPKGSNKALAFEYKIGDNSWQKVSLKKPIWQLELAAEQATKLELRNNSKQMVFARLVSDGIPAVMNETESANGLELTVDYTDMNGQKIEVSKLSQGTDFKAEVRIKNTGIRNYNELALHQVFPSGWEIHNTRLTGATVGGDKAEYQDFRDDRVYTFFDLKKGKQKTFKILLNASYLGKYYLPALSVEAMYDKSIQARKRGKWVTIAKEITE